ncbi:Ig-like domain-containing protein [Vagococcus silagei]|uniref:Nidogen G2 beta-barrel domain-containing protein n=1 Tax=Vagococcus silagei TaxID=2508885 RepID=A0A4V6RML2_9ENTE|nr:hypothetical protein [Vagococcus silagei]THB62329.1 hypothetical protein ESZ54_00515 [Vagococcus silagei]
MKRINRVLMTGLLVVMSLIVSIVACEEVVHADLYQDRIDYYKGKGYTPKNNNNPVVKQILNAEGKPEKFWYKIGGTDDNSKVNRVRANVAYYKNGTDLIHSLYKDGTGTGGLGLKILEQKNATSMGRGFSETGGVLYESPDKFSLVYLNKDGKYVLETLMEPNETSVGIKTEISIWNDTGSAKTYGVMYGHDSCLGPYTYENDRVPIRSLGANKGMYITNTTDVRLNYTFKRYKDNPTNFMGAVYSDGTFNKYTPKNANGTGVDGWTDDAPQKIILNGEDTGIFVKRSPALIPDKGRTFFEFNTGLGLFTTNPELTPEYDEYETLAGKTVEIKGDWFDTEGKANQDAVITGTWINGDLVPYKYKKSTNNPESGNFKLDVPVGNLSPGKYPMTLQIQDSTGRTGSVKVDIIILPNMEIEQKVKGTTTVINSILTGLAGKKDENYEVNLPTITSDNKFLIDTATPGYNKTTGKLTGQWTEAEVAAGKRVVDYYPVPTVKAEPAEYDMLEGDPSKVITGKWTDATKQGGTVEIKKGNTVIGSQTYNAGADNGTWSITIPKAQLDIGENTLTVTLKHNYSSFVTEPQTIKINRMKRVMINYYLAKGPIDKELLPESALAGLNLPKQLDKKVNESIQFSLPNFLVGQKYKLNLSRTGVDASGQINIPVTPTLNNIDIFYDLNQVTVETQFINVETGKAVFENLDSTDRRAKIEHGMKEVGTSIGSLVTENDKKSDGYDFDRMEVKVGGIVTNDGKVGDKPTVITMYFKPKFTIKPPKLDFGEHSLSIFNETKNVEGNPTVEVINTHENANEKITPWKVSGKFSGFKRNGTALGGVVSYDGNSLQTTNDVEIKRDATPNKGKQTFGVSDKMKLDVQGGGSMLGEFKGTMTWILSDEL